jgi:glycosyltransferase involved in cell wall biosynthesis
MEQKKNIVVATSQVPFYYGGNENLAEALSKALKDAGYNACCYYTPRNQYDSFRSLMGGYISNRYIDLKGYPWKNRIDQLITLTYPSYVIQHPNHVSWFTHRMREYYDLWERWIGKEDGYGKKLKLRFQRRVLHSVDDHYISRLKKLFCISGAVKARLKKWGDFNAEVLYPPPKDDGNYSPTVSRPYIFALSRLTEMKRMHLLVEAMSFVKNKYMKAYIAGEGEETSNLASLIESKNLTSRVRLLGRVTEEEKHQMIMECRAFYFMPYAEEYGISAVEAMKRGKAVITATDSGGPLDFVSDNKTGLVVSPDAVQVASAIDILADDEDNAVKLGKAALDTVKDITWENTVRKIVNI